MAIRTPLGFSYDMGVLNVSDSLYRPSYPIEVDLSSAGVLGELTTVIAEPPPFGARPGFKLATQGHIIIMSQSTGGDTFGVRHDLGPGKLSRGAIGGVTRL